MSLKSCCEAYIQIAQPKIKIKGIFSEIHRCPSCQKSLRIEFRCLGDTICRTSFTNGLGLIFSDTADSKNEVIEINTSSSLHK